MHLIAPEIRSDKCGDGKFGSRRGSRKHRGVDILCKGGSTIIAIVAGIVTKSRGIVYTDSNYHTYVEIQDIFGRYLRYMYVAGRVKRGSVVKEGQVIGISQSLQNRYKNKGMDDHIHLELIVNGTRVDPVKGLEMVLTTRKGRGK